MKNKTCHLTSAHNRDDVRIFRKECLSLKKAGFKTDLIVADGLGDETIQGVKVYDVGKLKGLLNRFVRTTFKIYKKALVVNADIYHFHDPDLLLVGLMLKRRGKKIIYDVHEDVPRQVLSKFYIPLILRKPLSIFIEKLENFAVKRFDRIVTATPFIKNRFLEIKKETIDINNFPMLEEFLEKKQDYNPLSKQICYVGALSKVRGVESIIKAITNIDITLVLAGKYQPENLKQELMQTKPWLESKVDDRGFVSRKEIGRILNQSNLGLVTLHPTISYLDSLPIKMFEYMAAGIPFIASNFPYWQEIVLKNNCGICVDPLNIKEIEEGINYILNNPVMAKNMGINGRKAIEKKYNWNIEEKKLIEVYNHL